MRISSPSRAARLATLLLLLALAQPALTSPQSNQTRPTQDQIRATVNRLFEANIKAGTQTIPGGIQAYTRVPISLEDIAEINAFGDDAIPILQEASESPKYRFRELAVRCLAYQGTSNALKALEKIVLNQQGLVASGALEWIGVSSNTEATSSLRRIIQSSHDPQTRRRATELLSMRSAAPSTRLTGSAGGKL